MVSPGKFLFALNDPGTINHLVIFLTGERLFDPSTGASIFFNTDRGVAQAIPWKYLGILSNEKPSAIFKLSAVKMDLDQVTCIEIGISIEPILVLEQQMMENSAASSSTTALVLASSAPPKALTIAQRIGESMFNYITSFARPASAFEPSLSVVPVRTVQDWFNNLLKRATSDPEGFMRQFMRDQE